MPIWRKKNTIKADDNNRVNIVLAIIFILGGGILFRLYSLQVLNYDLYVAKATSQHEAKSVLEPERGRIFIQDSESKNRESSLYPIAANKKFALLFAIPKELKEPEKTSEILYDIFKKSSTEKEVALMLEKEDKENIEYELSKYKDLETEERIKKEEEVRKENEKFKSTEEFKESRKIRIEAEIEKRKKSFIVDYMKVLTKKNDPYEPLEPKIDDDILKEVFARMAGIEGAQIKSDDIEIRNDLLYLKSDSGKSAELKISGIGFRMKLFRYYPEENLAANTLGFVSYSGDESKGQYGLEGFFDEELTGVAGMVKTERSAGGDLIIVNDRQFTKPRNGGDLVLTLDKTIQFTVCQKLNAAVLRHGADGGSVIILEPKTGAIISLCSYPDYNPNDYKNVSDIKVYNNPAIFDQYEPGSIFKAITMSMAVDQEKVRPDTTYNDTGVVQIAGYKIENSDHKANGVVDMNAVLEKSLNTGAIFAMRKVGPDMFAQYIKNYGFGEKTGIELEGESTGDIKNISKEKNNRDLYASTASFGQGIAVTPLQMVSAFGTIANGGILMKPYLVKEIVHSDGSRTIAQPKQIRRVISEKASMLLGGMLVNVIENGHGKKAGVAGYYVGGKTGTAQIPRKDGRGYEAGAHIGSFAGFAPVNDPRFVMLVRIDHPRDVEWAESSAAPLFGDIASFLLNYWQVPTERSVDETKK